MADERFILTRAGYEELQRELERLQARRQAQMETFSDMSDYWDIDPSPEEAAYVDARTTKEQLDERIGHLTLVLRHAEVVDDDPVLAGLLREAFADFPQALEPLAVDAVVERLAGRLAARSDDRPRARGTAVAHRAVARARGFLAAEAHRTVASEELETVTGLDRFALSRHFRAATGTSPHRYQVGRRLARAQKMIAEGAALSDAAAATGFADQSHLTRHFAARFGLTPGRWATLARQS